jgi:hypothetical protein
MFLSYYLFPLSCGYHKASGTVCKELLLISSFVFSGVVPKRLLTSVNAFMKEAHPQIE